LDPIRKVNRREKGKKVESEPVDPSVTHSASMWQTRRAWVNDLTPLDEPSTNSSSEEEEEQENVTKNRNNKRCLFEPQQQQRRDLSDDSPVAKRQKRLLCAQLVNVPVTPELAEKGTSQERTQGEQVSPRFLSFASVVVEAEAVGGVDLPEGEVVPFGLSTPSRGEETERTTTTTTTTTAVSTPRQPPSIKRKYKRFKAAQQQQVQVPASRASRQSCRRSLLSQFQDWPKPVAEVEFQDQAIEAFFAEIGEYHSARSKASRVL
jgi:hypothetical protein